MRSPAFAILGMLLALSANAKTPELKILESIPLPPRTVAEAQARFGKVLGDSGDTKSENAYKEMSAWADSIDAQRKTLKLSTKDKSKGSPELVKLFEKLTSEMRPARDTFDMVQNGVIKEFYESPRSAAEKETYLRRINAAYPALASRIKELITESSSALEKTRASYKGQMPPGIQQQASMVESSELSIMTKLLSLNRKTTVDLNAP